MGFFERNNMHLYLMLVVICWELNCSSSKTIDQLMHKYNEKLNEMFLSKNYFSHENVNVPERMSETEAWNDANFYFPSTFSLQGGDTYDMELEAIFEDQIGKCLNMRDIMPVDILAAECNENRILAWASLHSLHVKWLSLAMKEIQTIHFNNILLAIDFMSRFDELHSKNECYIIVLQQQINATKMTVLKIDPLITNMDNVLEKELDFKVKRIKYFKVSKPEVHIIFPVKYINLESHVECGIDIYKLEFHKTVKNHSTNVFIQKFQTIPMKEINDIEPFIINNINYVAAANDKCSESFIFIFDAETFSFQMFQRIFLPNATDLEFFQMGYRYFLAGISMQRAVIFEWINENFIIFQQFFIDSNHEILTWHFVQTIHNRDALLLLVKSPQDIDLIIWSHSENRFVSIKYPVCITWFRNLSLPHENFNITQEDLSPELLDELNKCLWAKDKCSQVNEIHTPRKAYVGQQNSSLLDSENIHETWSKVKKNGMSCFPSRLATNKIVSFVEQDLTSVVIPFEGCIKTLIFEFTKSFKRLTYSNLRSKIIYLEDTLLKQENYLQQIKTIIIPATVVTTNTEQVVEDEITFESRVHVTNYLSVDNWQYHDIRGDPILIKYNETFDKLNQSFLSVLQKMDESLKLSDAVFEDVKFQAVDVVGKAVLDKISSLNFINNMDVLKFLNSAVLDTTFHVLGEKIFSPEIHIMGNVNTGVINHELFSELNIWTTHSKQHLQGLWYFTDITITQNTELHLLNNINLVENIPFKTSRTSIKTSKRKLFKFLHVQGNVEVSLIDGRNITEIARTAVTQTENHISGEKIFLKKVEATGNVSVNTMNNINLNMLHRQIVKNDEKMEIIGLKTFQNIVNIQNSVTTVGQVNKHTFPDDFVLRHNAIVFGKKTFRNTVTIAGNVVINKFLDNVKIENIVMLDTSQMIPGEIFFDNLVFNEVELKGRIDNLTIEELRQIVFKNISHITLPDEIAELITNELFIISINNADLQTLTDDGVFKNSTNIVFQRQITFTNITDISRIVNYQKMNNFAKQDFVQMNLFQNITATKAFSKEATFVHNVTVKGNVDNINLKKFMKEIIFVDQEQNITGLKTFTNIIIQNHLEIDGLIDNIVIPGDILTRSNDIQIVNSKKTFIHGIKSKMVNVKNIVIERNLNKASWLEFEKHRVTLSTDQEIFSTLVFIDNVEIKGHLLIQEKLNNLTKVQLIQNFVRNSGQQMITGPKIISGEVHVQTIQTRQGLNRIFFPTIVKKSISVLNNEVRGNYIFNYVHIHNNLTINYWQKENFHKYIEDTLWKLHQVTGQVVFAGTLNIIGNLYVKNINNIHTNKILSKTKHQNITGFYTINEISVKNMNIHGIINNIKLTEFINETMKKAGISEQLLTFQNDLIIMGNINVTNINNLNLHNLKNDLVLKKGPAKIYGKKDFRGSINIKRSMLINETVNGINIDELVSDIVFTVGNQEILEEKSFSAGFTIEGNITVAKDIYVETINSIKMNTWMEAFVFLNSATEIVGTKTFTGSVYFKDVKVNRLNNITLHLEAVTITGNVNQIITETKIFDNVEVSANVIGVKVNGYSIDHLLHETVMNIKENNILGKKTFRNAVIFHKMVNVNGQTCNVNWEKEVIAINADEIVTGSKKFHDIVINTVLLQHVNYYNVEKKFEVLQHIHEDKYNAYYRFLGHVSFLDRVKFVGLPDEHKYLHHNLQQLVNKKISFDASAKDISLNCENYTSLANDLINAPIKIVGFQYLQTIDVYSSVGFVTWVNHGKIYLLSGHATACAEDVIHVWNSNRRVFEKNSSELLNGKAINWYPFTYDGVNYLIVCEQDGECGRVSRVLQHKEMGKFEMYCNLEKFVHEATVLQDGNDLYIAMAIDESSSVIRFSKDIDVCTVPYKNDSFPAARHVTALPALKLLFFTSNNAIFVYWLISVNHFVLVSTIDTPDVEDIKTIVELNKQYIIFTKSYFNGYTVEMHEIISLEPFRLRLHKRIPSTLERKPISLETFYLQSTRHSYIAILFQKTGISVIKLRGTDSTEEITLPLPSADKMHVFLMDDIPYFIFNKIDERNKAAIYYADIKGTRLRKDVICPAV